MADSKEGQALLAAMREVSGPAEGDMTPADHLDPAHGHTVAAVHHASQAAGHLVAAGAEAPDTSEWTGDDDGRTMPAAGSPQAGYGQNRTRFAAGTGAAHAHRQAMGRRG